MEKIAVLGAGSWGIALAKHLYNNKNEITVWSALEDEITMLREKREHKDKLPGVILPEDMIFTADMEEAVKDKAVIVMAVPSPFVKSTSASLSRYYKEGQVIVNVAKGIEGDTLLTLSEVIEREIPNSTVAVLSGPSHAEEVGRGVPTTIVVATKKKETAVFLQNLFMNEVFRVYTSPDVKGVEIGAALKNVIALAAGIADGLGYGDNTKAALITRGMAEIARLGKAMGGKPETFYGLSGIGDLIVTCASMHSRNRRAGILLGQGKTLEEAQAEVKMVIEGANCAKAALALAEKYDVCMPIVSEVNKILFENKPARDVVNELMLRDARIEIKTDEWE
ncbi:MAG: NAD(P)H-dependent glycerol-3-phosphate dehydrogenase [Lachnospiraceae bacterium]|nr:NAD(P)H-dependent glycerol-3-phosphate dehydrogenase [Lachnospiraceae bacterium]